jgi:ABC-type transport system involved in Fe-S cluster assembly fused permease/ATPase subunit
MMQLFQPMFFLGTMYRELQEASVDFSRLYAILDEIPKQVALILNEIEDVIAFFLVC